MATKFKGFTEAQIIVKQKHIHAGVPIAQVKSVVLADSKIQFANGIPNEAKVDRPTPYVKCFDQELTFNPEEYKIDDVLDMSKCVVCRRAGRQTTSYCTTVDNIKGHGVLTHRIMVLWTYDAKANGLRVNTAFPVREDVEGWDFSTGYKDVAVWDSPFNSYTYEQFEEYFQSKGYILALNPTVYADEVRLPFRNGKNADGTQALLDIPSDKLPLFPARIG